MKPTLILFALGASLMLTACEGEKVEVLKSPCAGLAGSPCGPKRPVNGNYNQESRVITPAVIRAA